MPSRDELHLRDIWESILYVEEFVKGLELEAYRQEERTKSAVERKIQILTEAVIRLERESSEAYPDIDWKAYRGLGNFLRHSYHRVDDEIVWNTIKDDLPALKAIVGKALEQASAKRQ